MFEFKSPFENVCDFCTSKEIKWRYLCDSFQIDSLKEQGFDIALSNADWAVCDRCAQLIEEGKWHELALVSLKSMEGYKSLTMIRKMYLMQYVIKPLHTKFRTLKYGRKQWQ